MLTTHELARKLLAGPDVALVVRPEEDETHVITGIKAGEVGRAEDWSEEEEGEADWHMWEPEPCVVLVTEWDDTKMHTINPS